jgi:hypothetical protein
VKAGTRTGVTEISKVEGRSAPFPDKEALSRRRTIAKGFYSLGGNRYGRDQGRRCENGIAMNTRCTKHKVTRPVCGSQQTVCKWMGDGAYCNGSDKSGGANERAKSGGDAEGEMESVVVVRTFKATATTRLWIGDSLQ